MPAKLEEMQSRAMLDSSMQIKVTLKSATPHASFKAEVQALLLELLILN